MGLFSKLFGKRENQAGASLDRDRLGRLMERPPSFSLIAIPEDATSKIPAFLADCAYSVRRTEQFRGRFENLYEAIEQVSGENNSIVRKAWYRAADYTVLLDPEMVLIAETDRLAPLSQQVGKPVIAAIWERGSETVALAEFDSAGLVRQSWYCQSEPTEEQQNPHPEVVASPDSEGLRQAIARYGLHDDAVFE